LLRIKPSSRYESCKNTGTQKGADGEGTVIKEDIYTN